MMTCIDQRKVNTAIHECLEHCERGCDLLAGFQAFLQALKAQGWGRAELHAVEVGVRKVLFGLLDGAADLEEATNEPITDESRMLPNHPR